MYLCWISENVNVFKFIGQDTLIMMTREFDPITEKSIHPDSFGAGEKCSCLLSYMYDCNAQACFLQCDFENLFLLVKKSKN